jgi:hypothetical protein
MITGTQTRLTSSSATAFRTTSGPMPAGSPIVMPMRGKTRLGRGPGLVELWSECRMARGDALLSRRRTQGEAALIFLSAGAFNSLVGLEHVLDVPFKDQKIRRTLTIDLQRSAIVPLDCAFNLFTIE